MTPLKTAINHLSAIRVGASEYLQPAGEACPARTGDLGGAGGSGARAAVSSGWKATEGAEGGLTVCGQDGFQAGE